jgi:hypothetical protein
VPQHERSATKPVPQHERSTKGMHVEIGAVYEIKRCGRYSSVVVLAERHGGWLCINKQTGELMRVTSKHVFLRQIRRADNEWLEVG